jgi:uncharacterized protein (TIGR00299 family) protein
VTICYLDAFSGLSGDMLVGALADAGADPKAIAAGIESLGTGAQLTFDRVLRAGISATKFRVNAPQTSPHRHLSGILKMIDAADLPARAKQNAARVFERLGESEAAVHGVPVERVHFHEVGAVDSIADIVGACLGFELLGAEAIHCSAVNAGSGTVETQHGTLPVPAPATASLLRGKPVYARGPAVELTTPTGAAVAVTLAESFGAMPPMHIDRIGYGAGDKDFRQHANVLRILVGRSSGASEATLVSVLEANIDDLSPQILGYAMERLLEAGALDVSLQPVEMKKGRPGSLLRVIAKPEDRERLAALVFAETSTIGLRVTMAERIVEARSCIQVQTRFGPVNMKVTASGNAAPEYEDCRALARASGTPLKTILAEAAYEYQKNKQ